MRWSNSSLFTAQQCGEKFRRRYIEGDRRPSGVRAKRGTAVHRVANVSHMRQLVAKQEGSTPQNEALPTVEEAKDLAATEFDAAMVQGCAFSDEEKEEGVEKIAGEQKDAAVQMSEHYVGAVAPRIDPVGVERRVVIKPVDMDIEIVGIVDLISEEAMGVPWAMGENGEVDGVRRLLRKQIEVVNDLKTADRQPNEDAASKSQQLSLYALIRTAEVGKTPDKVRLRTLVRTRTGKTSSVEQTADISKDNLEAVAQRLNAAIESVKRGAFVPANPDSWWCSARYCEYFGDCRFAMGRTSTGGGA